MAAYYDVVDPLGGLVAAPNITPPYRKVFLGNVNFMSDTMFLMWFKTGYSSIANSAIVRVNGQEIGKLLPRPWLDHNYVNFEAESLILPRTFMLGAPYFWSPVYNLLEIVPVPGADDGYVLLDKVFFFRNTS